MERPQRLRHSIRVLALVASGLLASLVLGEVVCRVYALRVYSAWKEVMADPAHYFQRSENPILGYELESGKVVDHLDGMRLVINPHGIRDDGGAVAANAQKIAILGDSVTFGWALAQGDTIPHMLQQLLDPTETRVKVLNFGVPGYGFAEIAEFLRVKDAIYQVDAVVYLLNANDFTRRDSATEGADNGIYRMYNPATFVSRWFLRKAIYRLMKGGDETSIPWYRWIFDANESFGFENIRSMKKYAAGRGIPFSVVLLPVGIAYTDGGYDLSEEQDRIAAFLTEQGVPLVRPIEEFRNNRDHTMTYNDHFTPEGNSILAEVIREQIERDGILR